MTRKHLFIPVILALACGCAEKSYRSVPGVSVPAEVHADALAGHYCMGCGLGGPTELIISSDGQYSYTLRGCMFYGTATGTWSVVSNTLCLSPETITGYVGPEEEMRFDILMFENRYILVDSQMQDYFIENGPYYSTCFQKKEALEEKYGPNPDSEPNNAEPLEPAK